MATISPTSVALSAAVSGFAAGFAATCSRCAFQALCNCSSVQPGSRPSCLATISFQFISIPSGFLFSSSIAASAASAAWLNVIPGTAPVRVSATATTATTLPSASIMGVAERSQ